MDKQKIINLILTDIVDNEDKWLFVKNVDYDGVSFSYVKRDGVGSEIVIRKTGVLWVNMVKLKTDWKTRRLLKKFLNFKGTQEEQRKETAKLNKAFSDIQADRTPKQIVRARQSKDEDILL